MYLAGKKLIVDTIFTASPTKDGTTALRGHLSPVKSSRLQGISSTFILHLFFETPPPPLELTAPDQAPLSTAKSFRLS